MANDDGLCGLGTEPDRNPGRAAPEPLRWELCWPANAECFTGSCDDGAQIVLFLADRIALPPGHNAWMGEKEKKTDAFDDNLNCSVIRHRTTTTLHAATQRARPHPLASESRGDLISRPRHAERRTGRKRRSKTKMKSNLSWQGESMSGRLKYLSFVPRRSSLVACGMFGWAPPFLFTVRLSAQQADHRSDAHARRVQRVQQTRIRSSHVSPHRCCPSSASLDMPSMDDGP